MKNTLIHHSIEIGARLHPDRCAYRCRDQSLSYADLFTQAKQLANALVDRGLKPLDRVGIHMPKSIELPVALYGILMAGGAYVPIDATAPIERVEFMLKDCGIRILITNTDKKRTIAKLAEKPDLDLPNVIGIEREPTGKTNYTSWQSIRGFEDSILPERVTEDDLAYIMYTSGSTGVPKGLMHTHRSGLCYARYSAELYQVQGSDVLGNHAPLHFDISTFEFLTGPYAGATVVLIPEEEIMFPASLARFIEQEKLTFWYSVPLALTQLVTRGDWDELDLTSLRWVLFGGEPFPPKFLKTLMQRLPNARFSNVYGPAEVNQCTFYNLPPEGPEDDTPIPLGKIWDGARSLLIDDQDQAIANEGTGELLISSPTMMKGYWARKDLDEVAFYQEFPVPGFSRKYYRTGDLVRRDVSGTLHFLGRKDRQIKLRGYRIELDEIEAAFTDQSAVEEAAAILVIDSTNEKKIVVLLSLIQGQVFEPQVLLKTAKAKLPTYATPALVESIETFPRTGSGKIDRPTLTRIYNERTAQ